MVKSNSGTLDIEDIHVEDWIRNLIPPRSKEEQMQLQENIEVNKQQVKVIITDFEGEENVLIDGHGRYDALKALNRTSIKFTRMEFRDRATIESFMLKEQLGRRNLTTRQRNYLMGSLAHRKQVDNLSTLTHEQIADIFKVNSKSVQRALKYFMRINELVKAGQDKNYLLELSVKALDKLADTPEENTNNSKDQQLEKKVQSKKLSFKLATKTKNEAKVLAEQYKYDSIDFLIAEALELLKAEKETNSTINQQ